MTFLYVKMSRLYRHHFITPFNTHIIKALLWGTLFFIMTMVSGCLGKARPPEESASPQTLRKENSKNEFHALTEKSVDASGDATQLTKGSVTFFRPITLKDAIVYALTHNIDAEVKKLEKDIQEESANAAKFKMLPSLTVDGTLSRRNTYDASSSDPLFTEGEEDFNYSRNKTTLMANAELSWDLIDFGISYYQHKQARSRISILEQQRVRVVQNLRFNIIKTFWETQVSKQAMQMAKKLIQDLTLLEKTLQSQIDAQTTSQIEALETAAALSEMKLKLSEFEFEYKRGKTQLAMLMGLPEKTQFDIQDADFNRGLYAGEIDIESLEKEALNNRPELFEQDIEELITLDEARIAAIEKIPKTSLFYRYDYDKDPHLYYDQWHTAGIRISFDLLSLPEKQSRSSEIALRSDFVKKRRLSVAAAILTQLNLSVIDFQEAKRTYDYVDEIAEDRKNIVAAHKKYADSGVGIWEDVIKNEVKYMFAHVRRLNAYADMIVADQRIANTVGRDLDRKEHLFLFATPKPAKGKKTDRFVKKVDVPLKTIRAVKTTSSASRTHYTTDKRPYTLQLSSYQSLEKAVEMLPVYEKKGLSPYIVKMKPVGKGEWFRCYAGLFRLPAEGERVITASAVKGALVTHTPYAASLGVYENKSELLSMKQHLIGMGYYPYSVEMTNNRVQLFLGAFYYENDAINLKKELQEKGVTTQVVLR